MSRAVTVGILILFSACSPSSPPTPAPLPPVREITVGEGAGQLTLLPDGKTLLVNNLEENTFSVVDLAAGREIRRISFDLVEEEAEYIRCYHVDPDGRTVWAACNHGRLLRVDLETGEVEQLFRDERYYFTGIVRDAPRNRLVLGADEEESEEAGFFAFDLEARKISWLEDTAYAPSEFQMVGSRICFIGCAPAIWGDGDHDSTVGILNLETDELDIEHFFRTGIAFALTTGPDGDFWLTDIGASRLFRLSPDLEQVVVRPMIQFWDWSGVGACPYHLDLDRQRVFVLSGNQRVLEYERRGEFLSDLPVREYVIAGEDSTETTVGDVLCLPDGRLLVADYLGGRLLVLEPGDGRPFSGF